VTEAVDPDPRDPAESDGTSTLGGRQAPEPAADPTAGGKEGQVGSAPSITADEPDSGESYPVGGGHVTEETDAPPAAGSGS
jgi:hypothetical protein